ncbi:MAG: hypothetical protein ACFHHU_03685 [Porticoccaceae bacterium]
MGEVFKPENADEVCSIVKDSLANQQRFELMGQGTRRALGRPVQADAIMDLSALNGIQIYEPEELVMVVARARQ